MIGKPFPRSDCVFGWYVRGSLKPPSGLEDASYIEYAEAIKLFGGVPHLDLRSDRHCDWAWFANDHLFALYTLGRYYVDPRVYNEAYRVAVML